MQLVCSLAWCQPMCGQFVRQRGVSQCAVSLSVSVVSANVQLVCSLACYQPMCSQFVRQRGVSQCAVSLFVSVVPSSVRLVSLFVSTVSANVPLVCSLAWCQPVCSQLACSLAWCQPMCSQFVRQRGVSQCAISLFVSVVSASVQLVSLFVSVVSANVIMSKATKNQLQHFTSGYDCGYPSSCTKGTGSFPWVKSGRGVGLTPHPLLVLWSRKSRAIPQLSLWAVRPVQSFSACTSVHFTFTYTSTLSMGRTACTEPQCLYKGALYLFTLLLLRLALVVSVID